MDTCTHAHLWRAGHSIVGACSAQRLLSAIATSAWHAQEEVVEYVAATVRKLAQEAAAEGVRRLFLISVSAQPQT